MDGPHRRLSAVLRLDRLVDPALPGHRRLLVAGGVDADADARLGCPGGTGWLALAAALPSAVLDMVGLRLSRLRRRRRDFLADDHQAVSASYLILGFCVLPLWIIAGLGDYLCHRAARIQDNSGAPESILHLVQFGLVGLPVTLGLFLRANAGFFFFSA